MHLPVAGTSPVDALRSSGYRRTTSTRARAFRAGNAFVRYGMRPRRGRWCRDRCEQWWRRFVQREGAMRDAQSGMPERQLVIDRELTAMREMTVEDVVRCYMLVLGGVGFGVIARASVIEPRIDVHELDVLVRDAEREEVILGWVTVMVMAAPMLVVMAVITLLLVIVLVIAVVPAAELHDRAVDGMRVIVAVRGEVEVGQHLDTQQPQRGCHRRKCAAAPGRNMPSHR